MTSWILFAPVLWAPSVQSSKYMSTQLSIWLYKYPSTGVIKNVFGKMERWLSQWLDALQRMQVWFNSTLFTTIFNSFQGNVMPSYGLHRHCTQVGHRHIYEQNTHTLRHSGDSGSVAPLAVRLGSMCSTKNSDNITGPCTDSFVLTVLHSRQAVFWLVSPRGMKILYCLKGEEIGFREASN